MKKKTIANLIMCAVIALIVTAGILTAGHIRGWFDKTGESVSVLKDIVGVIRMERGGVSYPVQSDTALRTEDQVTSESGATAKLCLDDDYITIGSSTKLVITDPSLDSFHVKVTAGEVFVNTAQAIRLTFDNQEVVITNATAALSVRSGAQTLYVFRGVVGNVTAGQATEYVDGTTSVAPIQLSSLNDFLVSQIRSANKSVTLCYSNEDLDELASERQQALQDLINSAIPLPSQKPSEEIPTEAPSTAPTQPPETEHTSPSEKDPEVPSEAIPSTPEEEIPSIPTEPAPTEPKPTEPKPTEPKPTEPKPTEPKPTEPKPTEPEPTEPTSTEPTQPAPTEPPLAQPVGSCYITIRCDTILNNMGDLEPGKAEFVPADGEILPVVEVPFYDGETVFEALKRVCELTGIQLEYSWTPLYDSYYIEGINNLYEFDCGIQSGWMYKVNEWFPNYGCSSYELVDGDVIVWCYTCQGLGEDVGGPEWME